MPSLRNSSVAILGVPIDDVTMDDVLWKVEEFIHEGGFHQIATANVDFLINSIHDPELKEILASCHLVLPDGMPLVWASRLMRASLRERVSGSDLVPRLVELSAHRRHTLFLLGGSEAASQGAAAWIAKNYPQARIVGRYSPPYRELEEMNHEEILQRIEAVQPDILLTAFGSPKQEKWIAMHRHRLRVPVCIGIGGSFDLLAGLLPRAPLWMQSHGLEWLYRTCQEPSRLGRRYARDASGLVRYMTPQLAAVATQERRKSQDHIAIETVGAATIMHVAGNLTGKLVAEFEDEARFAVIAGHHVILDLANTKYLGPDTLGSLIHLENLAKRHSRELWLTGMRSSFLRLLHATQLDFSFRTAPKVAEALRRLAPAATQISIELGKDWAVCRVSGRLIPLRREEATGVCGQILQMIERGRTQEATQR